MSDKNYRVYIDGIFDLFHRGHVESLYKAKTLKKNVTLIVGIISDGDATEYKRKPIYNEDDRYTIIKSIKYVDEVIFGSPLILTKDFITKNNIDIVLHGFKDEKDYKKQIEFTKDIEDIFQRIPYFPYISTTDIISDINNIKQVYLV